MRCARGRISHSTRNTIRIAICAKRMVRRVRRSRRSQCRYCELAAPFDTSPFDMDFELLPQRIEVAVELGRVPRSEWGRTLALRGCEPDGMVRLHAPRPPRQHDDPLGHADRLADVVGHQDRGLALAAEDF